MYVGYCWHLRWTNITVIFAHRSLELCRIFHLSIAGLFILKFEQCSLAVIWARYDCLGMQIGDNVNNLNLRGQCPYKVSGNRPRSMARALSSHLRPTLKRERTIMVMQLRKHSGVRSESLLQMRSSQPPKVYVMGRYNQIVCTLYECTESSVRCFR
jgi:hypothetical protein